MAVTESEVAELLGSAEAANTTPPAPSATTEDEVAALLETYDSERAQRIHNVLGSVLPPMSVGEGADRDAAVLRLAEETGVPVDLVRRNFDALQNAWQRAQFDPRRFMAEQPALADLVERRPELAPAVAKDLTLTTTAAGAFWRALSGALSGSASITTGWDVLAGLLAPPGAPGMLETLAGADVSGGLQAAAEAAESRVAPEAQQVAAGFAPEGNLLDPSTWTLGPSPSVAGLVLQGAEVFGGMLPIVASAFVSGGAAAGLGALQSGGAAAKQARETVLRMATTPTSLEAGAPMEISESPLYLELRAHGFSHEDATEQVARAAEQWALALTAPVGALGGAATSRILSPTMRIAASRGVAAQVAARVGAGAIEEGAQEALEGIAAGLGTEAGARVDVDVAGGTFGDFLLGALAGGGTGAVGSIGVVRQRIEARSQERAGAIMEAAGKSSLAKASPASFAEVIAAETARSGEPVTAIYLDAEATLRLFQEHKTDPVDVLGEDGAARLQEAAATGAKLELPVAEIGPLAAHPAAAQLAAEHVATRPGYQTRAEARRNAEADATRRAELVALYESDAAPEMTPEEARIIEGLQAQLAGTRVTDRRQAEASVAQLRAFVQTMSERFGLAPEELFPQYRIAVQRAAAQQPATAVAQGEEGPRGWMERLGDTFRVYLTRKADLSTFLHESGHILLELHGDLAAREDAPQSVRDDYAALLNWLGVESREQIQREHHEKFARGYEAYLREGNAPSERLRRVFERFRIWLSRVYRDIRQLNVELSDDIRGVFDRMLATDEEIERARVKAGLQPRPTKPDWMTLEEWQAYQDAVQRAEAAASKKATLRMLEERRREQEAWWREELRREIAKAEEEYDDLKETRDWKYVRFSTVLGVKMDPPVRLDRAAVEEMIGKDAARRLHGVLVKKGGMRPDDLAAELGGYANGREMLTRLLAHPDKATWARRTAEERMRERHGDLLRDRAELARLIQQAQHSGDGFSDAMLIEWMAINSRAGGSAPSVEAIKAAAREIAQRKQVGYLSSERVLAEERRAAERLAMAQARRDWEAAKKAGRERLLNHFLYSEIVKAERQLAGFEELADQLNDDKRRARVGIASPEMRDATDALLILLGLRAEDPDVPPFQGVAYLAGVLNSAGVPPVFDQDALARILNSLPAGSKTRAPWEKLTVADLAVVHDVLAQLKHAGTVLSELAIQERRRTFADLAEVISEEAATQPDLGLAPKDEAIEGERRRRRLTRQELIAIYTDPEEMFRRLGPTAHAFFRRFLDAQDFEMQLSGEILAELVQRWDELPAEMQERRYEAVDASMLPVAGRTRREEGPVTREWAWMIFLNRGNAGNLQRLLDGYGWTLEQVDAFLSSTLTAEEAKFLQGILDITEKLRPHAERIYERVHGVRPGRVPNQPFTLRLADGTVHTFRGGYFPARYDVRSRDRSSGMVAARQADAGIQDARASAAASVAQSFTKARAARFTGVISLDWNVVPSHISQVIHYVSFEEFVRDANRLFAQNQFLETVERRLGEAYTGTLQNWVKTVASARDESVSGAAAAFFGALGWVRSRTVLGALGYSVTVVAPDVLNLLTPVVTGRVTRRSMARAIRKAISGGFGEMRREALAASRELRKRQENLRDTLQHRLREIGSAGNRRTLKPLEVVREYAYVAPEAMDAFTSTIIWWAAREDARQAMADAARQEQIDSGRLEQAPLTVVPNVEAAEAAAVDEADAVVRQHQIVATMLEQPAILRDRKGIGAVLAMFSFWSRTGNIGLQLWHDAETRGDKVRAFARWYAVMLVANLAGSLIGGAGPEDDETWAEWGIRKALSAPFLALPILGSLAEAGVNQAVSLAFHGELRHRRFSFFTSPVLASIERIWVNLERAANAEEPEEAVGAVLEAAGLVAKLPVSQPKRTLGAAWRMITGETEAADPLDVADKLLYGDSEWRGASPLSIGSDLISGE